MAGFQFLAHIPCRAQGDTGTGQNQRAGDFRGIGANAAAGAKGDGTVRAFQPPVGLVLCGKVRVVL